MLKVTAETKIAGGLELTRRNYRLIPGDGLAQHIETIK
jgi:hypothetical protein